MTLCLGVVIEGDPGMNRTDCDQVSRIAGGAHSLVWALFIVVVAAATLYDVTHWVTGW